MTPDLVPVDEVCAVLHISRRTYSEYVRRYPKQFKTAKFGKRRLMRREVLVNFIEFKERLESRA